MREADTCTDVRHEAATAIEVVVDIGKHDGATEVEFGVADSAVTAVKRALSSNQKGGQP